MASVDMQKQTYQAACARNKHFDLKLRQELHHSNEDIQSDLVSKDYFIGCTDYRDAMHKLKARTEEVDDLIPPKRKVKDRVECIALCFTCPEELQKAGKDDLFFQTFYKAIEAYFGPENVHGGTVHKDEVHTYTDKDGMERQSLEHCHMWVSPYTPEHGINGKNFYTKAMLRDFNAYIDEVCERSFGMSYSTGGQAYKRSVEELKSGEVANELAAQEDRLVRLTGTLDRISQTTGKLIQRQSIPVSEIESMEEEIHTMRTKLSEATASMNHSKQRTMVLYQKIDDLQDQINAISAQNENLKYEIHKEKVFRGVVQNESKTQSSGFYEWACNQAIDILQTEQQEQLRASDLTDQEQQQIDRV